MLSILVYLLSLSSLQPAFGSIEKSALGCVRLGGMSETVTNKETQKREEICQIDNNGNIAAETLYRVVVKKEATLATEAYLKHPSAKVADYSGSPAWRYCVVVGGKVEAVLYPDKSVDGMCRFKDGSQINVWTLYYGPKASGNRKLTQILSKRSSG